MPDMKTTHKHTHTDALPLRVLYSNYLLYNILIHFKQNTQFKNQLSSEHELLWLWLLLLLTTYNKLLR